jgi:hypothetical protein
MPRLFDQSTVNLLATLTIVVQFLLLQGCYAISDPDLWPSDFVQKDKLPELIGKSEPEVLEELGVPRYVVRETDGVSYLYEKIEKDTLIGVFIYVPIGFSRKYPEVSCVLLNFDEEGVLREYHTESGGAAHGAGYEVLDSCTDLFVFNDSDLINGCVYARIGGNLRAEDEYQEYLRTSSVDTARLYNLCHAADQGHPKAQIEVGRHFGEGVAGAQPNLGLAYVWYSLAIRGCFSGSELQLLKDKMSPQEVAEAEQMLANWKPGQCERDLIRQNEPLPDE